MHPLDIPEVALHLGAFLDSRSLLECILVSRPWYQAFLPTLWRTVCLPSFGVRGHPVSSLWSDVLQQHGHLIHELNAINLFPNETIRLVEVLDVPNLQNVILCVSTQRHGEAHRRLKSFLRRHQDSLQSLTLLYGQIGLPWSRSPEREHSVWNLVLDALGGNNNNYRYNNTFVGRNTDRSEKGGDHTRQRLRSLTVDGALVYWQEELDACPGIWEFLRNLDTLIFHGWHAATPDPKEEIATSDEEATLSLTEPGLPSPSSSPESEPSLPFAQMAGAKIRDLRLFEGDAGVVDMEAALIQQCTELRSLTWCNDHVQDGFQEAFGLILDRLPFVNSIDLGIPRLSESDCILIFRNVRQPLRKLVLREVSNFSTRATYALLEEGNGRHGATLETLRLSKSNGLTGLCMQMILSSCPRLQSFQGINGIQNKDMAMDPREWACKGLRELELIMDSKLDSMNQSIIEALYSVDDFMRSISGGRVTVRNRKSPEHFNLMFERMKALNSLESLTIHGRQCTRLKEAIFVDRQVQLQWSTWMSESRSCRHGNGGVGRPEVTQYSQYCR